MQLVLSLVALLDSKVPLQVLAGLQLQLLWQASSMSVLLQSQQQVAKMLPLVYSTAG